MKCSCDVEPTIRTGKPVREGEKIYWKQIFKCDNPNCTNYKKDIGEKKINIFDETDTNETTY